MIYNNDITPSKRKHQIVMCSVVVFIQSYFCYIPSHPYIAVLGLRLNK